jgi:hypothetical protein
MTPRYRSRVSPCTREQARERRDQARAFLEVAEMLLTGDEREVHVATALAVLSGIAAADAICGLQLSKWSRGSDHGQAVELLATVSLRDSALPSKLRDLLGSKDEVHYSPRLVTLGRAKTMLREARALLAEAEVL